MRTPFLLPAAWAFMTLLCLAVPARAATLPCSIAARDFAEPLGADGIQLDFSLQELALSPDAAAKHPGAASAVTAANREMKAFIVAENRDLYRRMPELFKASFRAGARHVQALFNVEEVRIDRSDGCFLAVSAVCAARLGSRPDVSGYAAVYDVSSGRRLAFADIVADRRRFADALVAEARAQDPDLPESVRDAVMNNPFMPKPGVQYLPISVTDKKAVVFFPLMSNMLKEVSIPFAKHPGVFTKSIQEHKHYNKSFPNR